MKIIIAGIGEVGFHLANLLASEGHDLVVIDKDAGHLEHAKTHLDVHAIKGSSLSYAILKQANISQADLFIAVTAVEETNIATAILSKKMGAERTIARVSNTEFLHNVDQFHLRDLGIDEIIIPESLAAREIMRLLRDTALTDTFEFDEGALTLVGMALGQESRLVGKTVVEAWPSAGQRHSTNVAILRNNKTLIPKAETRFELGDHAYFITNPKGIDGLIELSGRPRLEIKNLIILGASRVGVNTVQRLHNKYNIKIIEMDRAKCLEVADAFPSIMVINGDGRDIELLEEEGIGYMDAFLALTGDSETNIISSLVAKSKGVAKTIAMVENMEYIHLSQSIGIDTLINKKLISANFIFRHVRQGDVVSLTSIHGVDAEVLEFEVKEASKILEKSLKELKMPTEAVIGGVVRKGVGYAPGGDFILCLRIGWWFFVCPAFIHQVERFFA